MTLRLDDAPCPSCHSDVLHHYIIVREDLPRGIQAAQIAHAAGESSPGKLPSGTHVVVLACKNERELNAASAKLSNSGLRHVRIEEPDAPYNGALMAIGFEPASKEVMRRHLSSLPLLR